jgi:type I pantothenate kinase
MLGLGPTYPTIPHMASSLGDGLSRTRVRTTLESMASVHDSFVNGSPFDEYNRASWAALSSPRPLQLSDDDLERIRSTGDKLDAREVTDIYQPLAELLGLYVETTRELHRQTRNYLGSNGRVTPFVIGVAGSVAVGKSTTSRILRELLALNPSTPTVQLVTTDGFLWPTAELESRGILNRKGFPESYDRKALLRFVTQVKSGVESVSAPAYSHLFYDRVEDQFQEVTSPDVLIVEGLNVLQPPSASSALAVSDLFDFSIYVDAKPEHIAQWYVERFLTLQQGAFADPRSYFHRYSELNEEDARAEAARIWREVNEPNLVENILPTRPRASLILNKDHDHRVNTVSLRKV